MSDAVLVLRAPAAGLRRWRIACAIATLALASVPPLMFAAATMVRLHREGAVTTAAARSQPVRSSWVDVVPPQRRFALDAPLLRGLASTYAARRRSDGEREDLLAYGIPGFEAPAARLRIRRRVVNGVEPREPPLFAAMAREAAEAGFAVEHAGLADLMPTRFGAFEVVELTLGDGRGAPVQCTGFRLVLPAPALTLGGLACGALGAPIERAALACLVDRLDLVVRDEDLLDLFGARTARRGEGCAATEPDPGQAAWQDDKPVTHGVSSRRH